jgi:hypothetical protein
VYLLRLGAWECLGYRNRSTSSPALLCLPRFAGLQLAPDLGEWEVVFPALWRREPVDAASGSGGSVDPSWVRGTGGGGGARAQLAGSSREVRSVAPAPLEEPAEGQSESGSRPPAPPGVEEDEELESQELPRGSSGAAALTPGAPASWQPPPPPQPPPTPPAAQQAEPDGEEVLLRIPASSRDLYLLLRRDGRFLAQRFAVEQRPSPGPGPGPTRAAAALRPPVPPDAACFYSGAVLRHPGSLASFSTCGGGLVSAFFPRSTFPATPLLSPPPSARLICMHLLLPGQCVTSELRLHCITQVSTSVASREYFQGNEVNPKSNWVY